jgi:hypothetical protein
MILDNVYKNTITFPSSGNIEFNFRDNKSETRYLLDIIIDDNIMINNVFSIGTYRSIGTIINNSGGTFGVRLDSVKVTLVLSGSHSVQVKIKQGIFSEMKNNVSTPTNNTIPVGYSFGLGDLIMTETQHTYYKDTLFSPFNISVLADVNSLLDATEAIADLYSPFSHNNDTYPKFAYTDKLVANGTGSLKNKNISDLIEDASIPNVLFINSNIPYTKLSSVNVQPSIDLANTSLQNIYVNGKSTPETKINGSINLNFSDIIRSINKNGIDYYNYNVDIDGLGTVDYVNIDFQSKIINPYNDGKDYFVSYLTGGEYGFEDMDLFFKKSNNIKSNQTTTETDDLLYSSSKLKALLFNKVDILETPVTPVSNQLVKMKVNTQGQVYENQEVILSDLSALLDSHYEKTGVKQVINTARSTIFFM